MTLNNIVLGATMALTVAAFVLALWPVVADAPWEKQETMSIEAANPIVPEGTPALSKEERAANCLFLAELTGSSNELLQVTTYGGHIYLTLKKPRGNKYQRYY